MTRAKLILLFMSCLLIFSCNAWARTCPLPEQVTQKDGKWSATGGWTQTAWPAPSPKARIVNFLNVTWKVAGPFAPTGKMLCTYQVKGQKGVLYAEIGLDTPNAPPMGKQWACHETGMTMGSMTCVCSGKKVTDCEIE